MAFWAEELYRFPLLVLLPWTSHHFPHQQQIITQKEGRIGQPIVCCPSTLPYSSASCRESVLIESMHYQQVKEDQLSQFRAGFALFS